MLVLKFIWLKILTSSVRRKKLFLNIFENKYRSTSSPKTHFYLVFPSKSEVKLFQAKRIKGLGSKCIVFAWGVCFLKGLEYFRRFSYKTTEIMEQHERRKKKVPLSLRAVLTGVKVQQRLRDFLCFAFTLLEYFLASQSSVIILACLHVFAAITIGKKYLLFAVIGSFDTHVFCNWQNPYFALV